MVQKFTNLKQKTLKLWQLHFKRLVSRQCEKTRFNGYVYDFSVNYDATDVETYLAVTNI